MKHDLKLYYLYLFLIMFGGLYDLELKQKLYLRITQFLPIFITIWSLHYK